MLTPISAGKKSWAGGFLFDPKKHLVLLHHRDGNTTFNPNKWAFFGGLFEGDETAVECFLREMEEETGVRLQVDAAIPLRSYLNTVVDTNRHVFFAVVDSDATTITLGEGAGYEWIPWDQVPGIDTTDLTKDDLAYFETAILPGLAQS